jgi:hypothetical protein
VLQAEVGGAVTAVAAPQERLKALAEQLRSSRKRRADEDDTDEDDAVDAAGAGAGKLHGVVELRAKRLADKLRMVDPADKERDRERIRQQHRLERWRMKKEEKGGYDLTRGDDDSDGEVARKAASRKSERTEKAIAAARRGGGDGASSGDDDDVDGDGGSGDGEEEVEEEDAEPARRSGGGGKGKHKAQVSAADLEAAALQLLKKRRTV